LLILEQSPHQLSARIFPDIFALSPRQKHLGLDAHQPGGHFQVVSCFVELQGGNASEKLLGDARDRNVVDVYLFVTNERKQQVERTRELGEVHQKDLGSCLLTGCQAHIVH
jgi:hypothetical protein